MENEFIRVVSARYIKDWRIEITFNNGEKKIVDFISYTQRGGVFRPLKDKEYFKKFFIDLHTVCWPNGADVAPERLYEIGERIEGNVIYAESDTQMLQYAEKTINA